MVIKYAVFVCLNAKVLPGVSIGECSVVSAGQIVRKSVPDYSMLADWRFFNSELPK